MQPSTLETVVLAGGLGTRLRDAYASGPKCMAPVAGRPFLEYVLYNLRAAGFERIILSVGYKKEAIIAHFENGRRFGLDIRYSCEDQPLGTAGALANASPIINSDPLLVLNGDSFFELDWQKLIEQHLRKRALATLAVRPTTNTSRYGLVEMDAERRIRTFQEKKAGASEDSSVTTYINGGIYLLSGMVLNGIRTDRSSSLERDVFPAIVGCGLYGCAFDGYFIDIGIPADFFRAQRELPGKIPIS